MTKSFENNFLTIMQSKKKIIEEILKLINTGFIGGSTLFNVR